MEKPVPACDEGSCENRGCSMASRHGAGSVPQAASRSSLKIAQAAAMVVLLASEVNPVIKALRDNGIEVTALHSHMLVETPHLFFMHFWANDDALKLARGLRAALDKVNVVKS